MNIFKNDGYLDFDSITKQATFIFMVLARGTGKTFGALKWAIDSGKNFIYMRRTKTQLDMIKTPMLNPFLSLERVLGKGYSFTLKPVSEGITGIFLNGEKQTKRGYMLALSTVSNVRGFDATDCDVLIYDEYIGEKHEKPIRNEGMAFLNAIETIGRNRELEGKPPLQVICLANSNDLANPIFIELGLVKYAERMLRKGSEYAILKDRDICIIISDRSPISERKKQTSLYRMVGEDSAFTQMAISNEFSQEFTEQVRSLDLSGFVPMVAVGEIVIYSHKSDLIYYVTDHMSGHPERYGSSEVDIKRFADHFYYLRTAYLNRHIFFESYILQVLFQRYMKI